MTERERQGRFLPLAGRYKLAAPGYHAYVPRTDQLSRVSVVRSRIPVWLEEGRCSLANTVWSATFWTETMCYRNALCVLPVPVKARWIGEAHFIPAFDNVGHLIHETLPRLASLVDVPDDRPLFTGGPVNPRLFNEMLAAFGMAHRPQISVALNERLDIEDLTFTDTMDSRLLKTTVPFPPHLLAAGADRLRSMFGDVAAPERIYVSRSDATKRRVVDEADFEAIAAAVGFTVVRLSGLSLSDQVRLFSRARVIAGPHGQGLNNLVWAPAGVTLVELNTKPSPDRMHHARLVAGTGGTYIELLPREIIPDGKGDGSFVFDVTEFRAVLGLLRG